MPSKEKINKVFKAIADPTRREIFHMLVIASAAMSISQISTQFEMTRQGVTKHIKLLEDAGMVNIRKEGRERFCVANPTPLHEIKNWLAVYEQFWDNKLKNLDDFLNQKS